MAPKDDLPLLWLTPESWVESATRDPLALLNDHAHLEKKAASNALDMLLRWPEPTPPENWVQSMNAIAIDEVAHLNSVTRLIARRGGKLSRSHRNPYASGLREFVRVGRGVQDIMDRLFISALIEARSCERFYLLAQGIADDELRKLYNGLYLSEAGHYRVFIGLARELPLASEIEERWQWMLEAEARLIQQQPIGCAMHSGMAA